MKLFFLFLFIIHLFIACSSVDYEYDYYDYDDDNDGYFQDKWHRHKSNHARKVNTVLDSTKHDQQHRYFIYKNNLMSIEDHNQAYKKGEVTFSLKENHFTHLTYEEFHDELLTPLQFSPPPIRAGSSKNSTSKTAHHHFKPVRKNKHINELTDDIEPSRLRRDINHNEFNQTEQNNTYRHHFHHINNFKRERYARLAAKFKKNIEKSNNGLFTLKAKAKSVTVIDWNAKGYVTPVSDQGNCGSCYTFAVAEALESLVAIKAKNRKKLRAFSKQQLLDCANDGDTNAGCAGGNIYGTYDYVNKKGIQLESSYPYVSQSWQEDEKQKLVGYTQKCKYNANKLALKTIKSIENIKTGDVAQMKKVLQNQTISAYIFVEDDLFQYSKGIYTNDQCSKDCNAPNHAVLITGWGNEDGTEYWIVKNSWSTTWGEKGYFRIEAGKNMCCIESYNSYATI